MSIPGCRSAYFNVGNACLARVSRFSRVGPRVLLLAYGAFPLLGRVLHLAADPLFAAHNRDKICSVGLNLIHFFFLLVAVGLRIVLCYRSDSECVIDVS